MAGAAAAVFSAAALRRHDAFWTGRFDLGNMVQAVWSTAHGRPLETTDIAGRQFVRLGAHADPVLVLFAPLWRLWPSPDTLLVAQAVAVAAGAVPVFLLGRRWLGDDVPALACAAAYLLYPPLGWSVVTEFHPVALATPLLVTALWAAEDRRPVWLAAACVLAALTKEQVGLAVAALGVWMLWRGLPRRWGAAALAGGVAWTALCVAVVIPRFAPSGGSPFIGRYAALGGDEREVLVTLLTRPWDAAAQLGSWDRAEYLLALLLPLLGLPLLAPVLLLGAVPDLLLNLLAGYWPQYRVENQYTAVITPFLVAGAVWGLARLRRRGPLAAPLAPPAVPAAALLAAALVGAWRLGPPLTPLSDLPGASAVRAAEFRAPDAHAATLARAVALIPDGAAVSATNLAGGHLSARRRILTWPVVGDAEWVVVDERRPYLGDRLAVGPAHRKAVDALRRDGRFRAVMDEDGVLVVRRVGAAGR
jgi:uncharacterized membrane protein